MSGFSISYTGEAKVIYFNVLHVLYNKRDSYAGEKF